MFISKREYYEEVSVRLQEGVDFTKEDLEGNVLVGGRLKELTSKARERIAHNNGYISMNWAGHYHPETNTVECTMRRRLYLNEEKSVIKSIEVGATQVKATEVKSSDSLDDIVTNFLHEVGVPAHLKGYYYLRDAVLMATENVELIDSVVKSLYPSVADKNKTTPTRVERAIRHAIEVAWKRGKLDTLHSMFGYTVNSEKGRPTNSEFIATIVDYLRRDARNLAVG